MRVTRVSLRSPGLRSGEEPRHLLVFHHLKENVARLLLVVPMMKLMQEGFHALEKLVRSFANKKVCTINDYR
jgi:hypothetical protein